MHTPVRPHWATRFEKDKHGWHADLTAANITQRMR